jgi:hypothetical protein
MILRRWWHGFQWSSKPFALLCRCGVVLRGWAREVWIFCWCVCFDGAGVRLSRPTSERQRPGLVLLFGLVSCGFWAVSTTAALDCFFPWQHRSDNGRRAISVLSTAWKVHVVECCGISEFKVWRCYSAGFLTGFVVRCFSSLAQSYGRRRSSLVKSRESGWGSFVISLISRVFVVKRVCSVDCPI